jgi:cytochrome o ubiquinol oxidase subunit 2
MLLTGPRRESDPTIGVCLAPGFRRTIVVNMDAVAAPQAQFHGAGGNPPIMLRFIRLVCVLSTLVLVSAGVSGCKLSVLNPAGPVSAAERVVLLDSLAIMLAIVVPTIVAILAFAYWFRASNTRAKYLPNWAYSGRLELIVWSIPALVVFFLGGIAWISAHLLDPAEPLKSNAEPLEIEVVSLDWKWLFIYPLQDVASVNRMVVPAGVPLRLKITSASVFNVFFVPQLGSEIYSMYGMTTWLNLQADRPGVLFGLSAHFSGDGFPGMTFDVHALPPQQFADWVATIRHAGPVLDDAAYRSLLKQSQDVSPYTYRAVQAGLFDEIVGQRLPPGEGPQTTVATASR